MVSNSQNPLKIVLRFDVISRFFPSNFSNNRLARVLHIQNVAGISTINKFSSFFNLIFGGFCHLAQLSCGTETQFTQFTQIFSVIAETKSKQKNEMFKVWKCEKEQILKLKINAISLRMCLVGNRNSKELPKPKREIFVCKKWRVRLKNHIKRWFDPFDSEVRICLFNYVIVFFINELLTIQIFSTSLFRLVGKFVKSCEWLEFKLEGDCLKIKE